MRGPEWSRGSFSVIIKVSFVPQCPSMPATHFMSTSTLDLHNKLLSFQTVDSHLLLSAFLSTPSPYRTSTHSNLLLLSAFLPLSYFPLSVPLPLSSPSLPVVLRPVSLTLPDSSIKRRNKAPGSDTVMQNNKLCLPPNFCSDPFFTPRPPAAATHLFIHPCVVCMKNLIASLMVWIVRISRNGRREGLLDVFWTTLFQQFSISDRQTRAEEFPPALFVPDAVRQTLGEAANVCPWNWSIVRTIRGYLCSICSEFQHTSD